MWNQNLKMAPISCAEMIQPQPSTYIQHAIQFKYLYHCDPCDKRKPTTNQHDVSTSINSWSKRANITNQTPNKKPDYCTSNATHVSINQTTTKPNQPHHPNGGKPRGTTLQVPTHPIPHTNAVPVRPRIMQPHNIYVDPITRKGSLHAQTQTNNHKIQTTLNTHTHTQTNNRYPCKQHATKT